MEADVRCIECDRLLRDDEESVCRFCLDKPVSVDAHLKRHVGERITRGFRMLKAMQNGDE